MDALKSFQETHPDIKILYPDTPGYADARVIYSAKSKAVPLAIAKPQTAAEVAQLVSLAAANGIELVVRTGGNDMHARSMLPGALVLDMRALDSVVVDKATSTAVVGGGVLQGKVAEVLAGQGFITPTGTIPWVGYVGWATLGGYGPWAGTYGLGVDQIVAAKVVNSKGEIVDADDGMLSGIRGAGGNFGVILELTIKIYPFDKILAGTIVFESSDFPAALQRYTDGVAALRAANDAPQELDLQILLVNTPMGRMFGVLFFWASPDHAAGQAQLAKITALGTVLMNGVTAVTMPEFLAATATLIPTSVHSGPRAINLRRYTPAVIDVFARNAATMPSDFANAISIHELRDCSPSAKPSASSVFGAREPHFLFELIAGTTSGEDEATAAAIDWAVGCRNEFVEKAPEEVLPAQWVPLNPSEELEPSALFGEHYKAVVELKKALDPEGLFKNALPRLV